MSPCKPTAPTSERGFSLLELFVVLSLLGIFLAAVQESLLVGLRAVNAADEREDIRMQLSNALDRLIREVSMANNVDTAQDQQLQFDADLNGDGTTENDILYQVSGGDLQRTYNGATVTLVRDLSSLDFDYTDLNGSALTTPVTGASLDILRLVQITATTAKDAETLSLADSAYLRNNE